MTRTEMTPAIATRSRCGVQFDLVELTRVGAAGWEWTLRSVDLMSGEVEQWTRRTNGAGRGLWQGDRQISGTSQYSLPAERGAAIRHLMRSR